MEKPEKAFIDIAKQDLYSSKVLYEYECYPQSVFLFQQSIEKEIKAIGIWSQLFNTDNARQKIGHKGMKLFVHANDNFRSSINTVERDPQTSEIISEALGYGFVQENFDEIKTETSDLKNWTSGYIDNTSEYIHLSYEELLEIDYILKKNHEDWLHNKSQNEDFIATDEEWAQFIQETTNMMRDLIDTMSEKYGEETINSPKNLDEFVLNGFKSFFNVFNRNTWNDYVSIMVDTNYIFKCLLCLSIIVDPHAIKAKYPDKNFNPLEFYSPDLPLVKKQLDYIDITEHILTITENIFKKSQELYRNV